MNTIREKIKGIQLTEEKVRLLLFALALFLSLFLARYLLGLAYSRYEVRTKITANIDKALYIFKDDETLSFNLEPDGIVPRDEPYTYRFSVSNFDDTKHSDVDLSYSVKVRTTTNLPITVSLYRNESYTDAGALSIFNDNHSVQDEDSAWYRVYKCISGGEDCSYNMLYTQDVTDIYTMVIHFPSTYASNDDYSNYIESIEVILESKQVI